MNYEVWYLMSLMRRKMYDTRGNDTDARCLGPLVLLLPKTFKLFDFPIFRCRTYLIKGALNLKTMF